jgi:tRNA (mo5U34)-methyltransferase
MTARFAASRAHPARGTLVGGSNGGSVNETGDTIESLAPWFYQFDLGALGKTETKLPPELAGIHQSRLEMLNEAIDRYFSAEELANATCLDVGCHEGFFAVAIAQRGARRVVGVDVREQSLRKASFAARALDLHNVQFRSGNVETLDPAALGLFDFTICFGLLYHLENPMLALRRVAALTKRYVIVETQVIDEIEGETEWGSRRKIHPYNGVLALIDETAEFTGGNMEASATTLATCPSPRGLETMLRHAGFDAIEFIEPPGGAYEQLVRRKRVVCVAAKQ